MDDTPLLKIEHDVRQLVGVFHHLVRRQTILWRTRGDVRVSCLIVNTELVGEARYFTPPRVDTYTNHW